MSKLDFSKHSEPLPRGSKAAMVQVGWLGQTGTVYGLDTPLKEIHKIETASYAPLYMQFGEWKWHDHAMKYYVEQDD